MQYRKLGNTSLKVSLICLGTMTWGRQNTQAQAFEQMDYAHEQGINFFDTAEMYPVPTTQKTQGGTEYIIGNWFSQRKTRKSIVLATKVTGPGLDYLRDGSSLTSTQIRRAVEDSLTRLQTDYIDLYQVHWPQRKTNFFGRLGYIYEQEDKKIPTIEETFGVLYQLQKEGKILHVGISNETPWGTMEYLRTARMNAWPNIVSIQNPYNLLNRTFEVGLAEIAHQEKTGLLAYSPLAFGMLSGKYENDQWPENARVTMFRFFDRYADSLGRRATSQYVQLAKKHGIAPAQLALAYVNSRPFLTSNIIGATTMEQLRENVGSIRLSLTQDIVEEIEKIHKQVPNPSP